MKLTSTRTSRGIVDTAWRRPRMLRILLGGVVLLSLLWGSLFLLLPVLLLFTELRELWVPCCGAESSFACSSSMQLTMDAQANLVERLIMGPVYYGGFGWKEGTNKLSGSRQRQLISLEKMYVTWWSKQKDTVRLVNVIQIKDATYDILWQFAFIHWSKRVGRVTPRLPPSGWLIVWFHGVIVSQRRPSEFIIYVMQSTMAVRRRSTSLAWQQFPDSSLA